MEYRNMTIPKLKQQLEYHLKELQEFRGDTSLERDEKRDLVQDELDIIGEIKDELEYRRELEEEEDSYVN